MKNLQYFVGKICTIFTTPINRDFKAENPAIYPQQLVDYFVGTVELVDEYGVMISHNNLKTWISSKNLVGIAEEEKPVPVGKKEDEIMASYKKEEPKKEENKFINLAAIEQLTKKYSGK